LELVEFRVTDGISTSALDTRNLPTGPATFSLVVPTSQELLFRVGEGGSTSVVENYSISVVPLPATAPLMLAGVAALAGLRRAQRRA
jgi:hypothetical protein